MSEGNTPFHYSSRHTTLEGDHRAPTQYGYSLYCLLVGICVLLAICAYWFLGEYAYLDDYHFVVDGNISLLQHWLSIGRPGTYWYLWTVKHVLGGNLNIGRMMSAVIIGLSAIAAYRALCVRGHRPTVALAMALALPASFALQLSIIWVNTGSSSVAALLAVLAYRVRLKGPRQALIAMVIFTASALIYQPTACIFFALYLLDWLLLPPRGAGVRDLAPFVPPVAGLGVVFCVAKVTQAIADTDPKWSGRDTLLHDVPAKLAFLKNSVLPVASSPAVPAIPYPLPALLVILCVLIVYATRQRHTDGAMSMKKVLIGIWVVLLALGFLLGAELPIIAVQEGWASARTLIPWSVLSVGLYGVVLDIMAGRYLPRKAIATIITLAAIVVGVYNAQTARKHLVELQIEELDYLTKQVQQGIEIGHTHFGMVLSPAGPVAERYGTYEYGWISSSADWPPLGMLLFVESRLGLPRGSLTLIKSAREPFACSCFIIDMRPFWARQFDAHSLEARRKAEQEAWLKKTGKL